ncbi:MAG: nucleoside hydrolase [Hylemonella sp.]|uniref:nucleoside hydrolase n=1 Tax=Hylemonella sp. TaxID=2066020 RepID=UPI0022CB99C7|nr:nucleoside hydrolase [Hylemonella sp.]MCZ8253897.1 nucleoside hydrolase [Hylemonella sp.]
MGHKILLDCDPGADDALALYFALAHPDLDLLALTTTYGRVPLTQATRNALLLCALAGRADLPVCSGVPTPLRKVMGLHDPQSHGSDGLGDLPEQMTPVHGADERSAARCIVELARAHPGQLNLVCAGPLGNVAQALRLEPHLPELLGQLVVAGGSIAAPGEVSPVAELNFWLDPHAADQVLTAGFRLTMLGLDVSQAAALPQAWVEDLATQRPHPALKALAHAVGVQARARAMYEPGGEPACPCGGLLGLLWLLQPGLFQTTSGRVRVVTEGLAEGQSILDRREQLAYAQPGWETELPKVQAALGVDAAAGLALLRHTLASDWLTARPD